jgi:hypothetical protein
MVGRAVGVLVDVPAEWEGSRWRVSSRVGRDARRARSLLSEDLDAVEDRLQGYVGPAKLQLCGPLTLAAVLELRGGEAAVSDPVATADIAASLAEGLVEHLGDLRRRVPGADWVVQIDEPALSSVTTGAIPRSSGWGTVAAVPQTDAVRHLAAATAPIEAMGAGVALHCCAASPDWGVLAAHPGRYGRAISVDLAVISLTEAAPVMEQWLDSGGVLWLGVDPVAATAESLGSGAVGSGAGGSDAGSGALEAAYARLVDARSVLGIAPERFAEVVAVTPPCGLGGSLAVAAASYAGVRTLVRRLRGDLVPSDGLQDQAQHRVRDGSEGV